MPPTSKATRTPLSILQVIFIVLALNLVDSWVAAETNEYDFTLIANANQSTPRFCGLVKGAQNFTCYFDSYANACAVRAIPVIVVLGVTLIVLFLTIMIAMCLPCCPPKCQRKCGHAGWLTKLCPLIFPYVCFAGGLILVFIFYFTSAPLFDSLQNETDAAFDQWTDLASSAEDILSASNISKYTSSGVNQDLQTLNNTISTLSSSESIVNIIFRAIYLARTVSAWAMVGIGVFIALLALIVLVFNSKAVFYFYIYFTLIVVLAAVAAIAAIEVTRQMVDDTCSEVQYQNGMFVLLQSTIVGNVGSFLDQADQSVQNATTTACNQISSLKGQACCASFDTPPCDNVTLPLFLNKTIIDVSPGSGHSFTVSDCANQCNNTNLKSASQNLVLAVYYIEKITALETQANEAINFVVSPSFLNTLYNSTCFSTKYFAELYSAAGCFLVGSFLLLVICSLFLKYDKDKSETS